MKILVKWMILIGFLYAMYTGYQVWTYGTPKTIPKADAAVVLGAAQWYGEPSPVFEGRLKQGIQLYKEGKVDYLIFTGGKSENAIASEAQVGKQYAIQHGVPENAILLEDTSSYTKENLTNAEEVAQKKDISSFLVVSDPFHVKRAVQIAEELEMGQVSGIATQYTAYETWKTKLPFFLREWMYVMGYQVIEVMEEGETWMYGMW